MLDRAPLGLGSGSTRPLRPRSRRGPGAGPPRSAPAVDLRRTRTLFGHAIVRVAAVLALACVAFLAASSGFLASLPGVGDAEHRIERALAAHHGAALTGAPPAKLADAVVAVEDEHFYSAFVVSIAAGAGRAAVAVVQRSGDPGGSTIPQQLAKLVYGRRPGIAGTLREIGLGVKLSLHYSKPEILSMYLNAAYYGHGLWGAATAARGYFGRPVAALDWAQAAMLAGLPQAPSAYDPLRHLALAKQRQRHVLDQLVANHYLSAAAAAAAYREPLSLR